MIPPRQKIEKESQDMNPFSQQYVYGYSDIKEVLNASESQAYMLVYIRDGERSKILETGFNEDQKQQRVPQYLIDKFERENRFKTHIKEDRDLYDRLGTVYLLSPEIVN
jgi:hypothetical protein